MKPLVAEKGFSLIEIILTIVIISVAITVAIASWSNIARHSSDSMWQTKVSHLGQAYLAEILTKRFDERTPVTTGATSVCSPCTAGASLGKDAGESRYSYDDVDDYNGLNESATRLFDTTINPQGAKSYKGYRVAVRVNYVGGRYGMSNDRVKQIILTITPPLNTGQAPIKFSALKGNY